MVLGLYTAFFTSHRRIWARVAESDGKVTILLAGNANKNREGFAETFQSLGDRMDPKTGEKTEG
jgi:cytochrome c biogenesis protein